MAKAGCKPGQFGPRISILHRLEGLTSRLLKTLSSPCARSHTEKFLHIILTLKNLSDVYHICLLGPQPSSIDGRPAQLRFILSKCWTPKKSKIKVLAPPEASLPSVWTAILSPCPYRSSLYMSVSSSALLISIPVRWVKAPRPTQ